MNHDTEKRENLNNHSRLIDEFEQITALLAQLLNSDYRSFELYLNNCRHLRLRQQAIRKILDKPAFERYLQQHDAALYYNINSISIALRLFENLLNNIRTLSKEEHFS
ncbi:hypothetical protein [Musicola paradisiaca]|uniref:Uncharacterized protein n=1 Tax=Musicola paradisiaca (strain Ech703) TaxID=579405 RepID=C6C9U3_MUSP7|nr:hypothetical protein [Musicola paradisiaca]ACS86365.1 conserved hypothetical protein [Musicola paradisiaca Ech703]